MHNEEFKNLTGFLLDWPSRAIQREDLLLCRRIKYLSTIGNSLWEEYRYDSSTALCGEDPTIQSPPFHYSLICRRSDSRILLLSQHRQVVEHLIQSELDIIFIPHLRRMSIAVDDVVRDITHNPGTYVLSFVHARVPAFGSMLRSVSFYGDNLAGAALFRDQLDVMVFFTCGLRYAAGGTELIRMGVDGGISFFLTETDKVLDIERVLKYLRDRSFLSKQ